MAKSAVLSHNSTIYVHSALSRNKSKATQVTTGDSTDGDGGRALEYDASAGETEPPGARAHLIVDDASQTPSVQEESEEDSEELSSEEEDAPEDSFALDAEEEFSDEDSLVAEVETEEAQEALEFDAEELFAEAEEEESQEETSIASEEEDNSEEEDFDDEEDDSEEDEDDLEEEDDVEDEEELEEEQEVEFDADAILGDDVLETVATEENTQVVVASDTLEDTSVESVVKEEFDPLDREAVITAVSEVITHCFFAVRSSTSSMKSCSSEMLRPQIEESSRPQFSYTPTPVA